MLKNFLHLLVSEDLLHSGVALNSLHNRIVLKLFLSLALLFLSLTFLFLCFSLLFVCYIVEVLPHQPRKVLHYLSEFRDVSILLHGFLWILSELGNYGGIARVGESLHQSRVLS